MPFVARLNQSTVSPSEFFNGGSGDRPFFSEYLCQSWRLSWCRIDEGSEQKVYLCVVNTITGEKLFVEVEYEDNKF